MARKKKEEVEDVQISDEVVDMPVEDAQANQEPQDAGADMFIPVKAVDCNLGHFRLGGRPKFNDADMMSEYGESVIAVMMLAPYRVQDDDSGEELVYPSLVMELLSGDEGHIEVMTLSGDVTITLLA